jgi:RNA recognition motif-containing protein
VGYWVRQNVFFFFLFVVEYWFKDRRKQMTIFVGNLSFDSTVDDIKKLFGQFGTVTKVDIALDSDKNSRGFAFVEMPDEAEGHAAITNLNGQEFMGRPINVSPAHEKRKPIKTGSARGQGRRSLSYKRRLGIIEGAAQGPVQGPAGTVEEKPRQRYENPGQRNEKAWKKPGKPWQKSTKPWQHPKPWEKHAKPWLRKTEAGARSERGERPAKPWEKRPEAGGGKPWQKRPEAGGGKPWQKRPEAGGGKPWQKRPEGGAKPWQKHHEAGGKPWQKNENTGAERQRRSELYGKSGGESSQPWGGKSRRKGAGDRGKRWSSKPKKESPWKKWMKPKKGR